MPHCAGPGAGGPAAADDAHVAFGATVLHCALAEVSTAGARVLLRSPAVVPDLMTLTLPGGEARPMRRAWQTGL